MHIDFNSHISTDIALCVYTLYYMVNRPVSRNNPRNDYKIGNVLLEKVSEERELHTGKCIRRFAGISRIAGTS